MSWEQKMKANDEKLMESYQRRFDKAVRDDWTPSIDYWWQKMENFKRELEKR